MGLHRKAMIINIEIAMVANKIIPCGVIDLHPTHHWRICATT